MDNATNNNRYTFTQEGYDKLKAELEYLKTVVREEISKKLNEAVSYGDLSENAAYAVAVEARDVNESRIAELEEILANAVIVNSLSSSKNDIDIGSVVTLEDLSNGEVIQFTVVGTGETDFTQRKFGVDSPMVSQIIGKKKGDEVEINTPAGVKRFLIKNVEN